MRDFKLFIKLGLIVCLAVNVWALPFEDTFRVNESTTITDETTTTPEDTTITQEDTTTTPEDETTKAEEATTTTTVKDEGTTLPQPVLCDNDVDFLPAPNCREYYHCLHGIGLLRVCPDNLYWDPTLNVCGWDSDYCQADDNEEPNNPSLDCLTHDVEFLPYQPDCSKFIQCVYDEPIKQHCPPGLLWNQPLLRCDYVCDYSLV